ncbi:MAG: 2-hydroxyacyl-CoA dehydratase [Firmicutes bacterium HGW-Firmicutes-16]|nr:MAG: 2-hydroxyacyl-CoA dehydratase [Firmicutes bacterium HGW-Firmicutes-16]
MAKDTRLEDAVMAGELSVFDFCCEKIEGQMERMKEKNPDLLWTLQIQYDMWHQVRDAHKNGKKLVFFGGPVPVDIIVAFDCVPVYLDTVPIRLSPNPTLTGKFIDSAEKYVPATTCGLCKTYLGTAIEEQYGVTPDAFVYSSVPCDSSRVVYPNMERIFNVPTFSFDQPFRRDDRGLEYLVDQNEQFVTWMEDFTGTKLDWDKMKETMTNANRTYELQGKCADLRKRKPCPLPGRMLVMNGTTNAMSCYPEMANLLEKELETGEMLSEMGMGPCPDGEKHRVALLQNMLWSFSGAMDWMEKEYGAVTVMDAFGYQHGELYEHMDDRHDCMKTIARKMQNSPMIHGAAGPTENYIYLVDKIFKDYEPDVSIFLGHIGCKHTWASAKIVTDMIQDRYGIPTLYLDVDGIDGRYKTHDEITGALGQYFETVVNK